MIKGKMTRDPEKAKQVLGAPFTTFDDWIQAQAVNNERGSVSC
jgi:hypothetical protein